MATAAKRGRRKPRGKTRRPWRIALPWPSRRWRRKAWQVVRGAPPGAQLLAALLATALCWLGVNWLYQVARKPSELFFPVSGTLNKRPAETWAAYAPLFLKFSTDAVTPELLAALAQVEGSGNPVAQTYWRWSFKPHPFDVYRPASSAVGMYQITDGTFAAARHYCIRHHRVIEEGPWNDWQSCWFNGLYLRVVPSHAVELTAVHLDRSIRDALARHPGKGASLKQKQELAAVIHLCGAGAGDLFVQRGMRLLEAQRCGDHLAQDYVGRVQGAMRLFGELRQACLLYTSPSPRD